MSLGRKAVRGTLWVAGGTYVNSLQNFLTNILLMRLIAPEYFGVLALALTLLTLGQKLFSFGFNHALIHRQEELESAVRVHQLLHLISSLAVLALIGLLAPIIEAHYDRDTMIVLVIVAVSAIAQTAGNTPRIRLEKELDFSPVMKVGAVSTLAGNVVGIAAALLGGGVWALVARLVVADVSGTVGYFVALKQAPAFRWDWQLVRWYYRFGAYLWLSGMATWVVLKFDDLLVGSMISTEELGYYARAYALACLPTTMVTHVVAKVAFPLYARLQDDREKLSYAFRSAMGWMVLLTMPLAVGLALLAREFVFILVGETWAPMIPVMQLLLIYASLRPMFDNTGELFTAVGNPKYSGLVQLAQAVAVIVLCPWMTWLWGAEGAAVAVGLVMAVGVFLAYRKLPRYVDFSFRELMLLPAAASVVGFLAVLLALSVYPVENLYGRFFFKGVVFVVGFVLTLALVSGKKYVQQIKTFIRFAKTVKE